MRAHKDYIPNSLNRFLGIGVLFRKILVPIDGSKHSLHAFEKAVQIALKFDGELTLLHVYSEIYPLAQASFIMGETEVLAPELVAQFGEVARKAGAQILESGKKKAKAKGVQAETLLREGNTVEEILKTAEEGGFDLIVIGARGLSRVKRIFLGSVSQRVTTHAPCPVLVTK